MNIRILLLGIFFLITANIFAQPYQWWAKSYSSPMTGSQDTSSSITIDNSGNVYVAGWVNGYSTGTDIILLKLNSLTGDTSWVRRYTGPGTNEDKALALTVDNTGFVYLTGYSFQLSRDIITMKYDGAGNLVWMSTFNGSNNGGDYGFAIEVDISGNVYVTGRSDEGNLQHFTTIKYNSSGAQQWAAVYNGSLSQSFDQAQDIAVDNSGNVYVTGFTSVSQNFATADYLTLKYNSSGNLQWEKRYNGTGNNEDVAVKIVTSGNNVYVTGRTDSLGGNYNYFTIKYRDSNGDSLASAFYWGPPLRQIDNAVCMRADNSGNIYVTGGSMGISNTFDYATVKYNADLQQQWEARYEGSGSDVPSKLIEFNSNIYVTGTSVGSNGRDFYTVKYNSSGSQVWAARFNGPANGDDHCASIAIDPFENVYVTGYANVLANENDIFTIRYSPIPIGIQPITGNVPESFKLHQNYPNPFNPSTNIKIDIPAGAFGNTKLIIYDVLGRELSTIVNEQLNPGSYLVKWDASGYSSGIYFYKLISGSFVKTNKMIMVE
jgi:hypothetical protein